MDAHSGRRPLINFGLAEGGAAGAVAGRKNKSKKEIEVNRIVVELIEAMKDELKKEKRDTPLHVLVTDLLKLLEAHRSTSQEEVREVVVRWIESSPEDQSFD